MEYNTQQRTLPLPEYGRSVQNMVDHALTIEDRAERNVVRTRLSTLWAVCFRICGMCRFQNINYGIIWLIMADFQAGYRLSV